MYKTKITFFNNFCLPSVSVKEKTTNPVYKNCIVFLESFGARILKNFFTFCVYLLLLKMNRTLLKNQA